MSGAQRKQLEDLLQEFSDIFAEPSGHALVEEQMIQVNAGARPCMQRPYSISPAKRQMMDKKIDQLIEKGYLEPCSSEWATPSLLVAKDDTQTDFRLVTDFRKLNEITVPDVYPLPRIDDILSRVRGKKFMSTVDLTNCYWQIPISPDSRKYFTTATQKGLFRYTRMPMGARNSSTHCQRVVEEIMRKIPEVTTDPFQDDLVVTSDDFPQHLEDLRKVFMLLRQHNFS